MHDKWRYLRIGAITQQFYNFTIFSLFNSFSTLCAKYAKFKYQTRIRNRIKQFCQTVFLWNILKKDFFRKLHIFNCNFCFLATEAAKLQNSDFIHKVDKLTLT